MKGLFRFQADGVNRIVQAKRMILGDEMGLGKTVQAIVACQQLNLKRVLIVCPKAVKLNWRRELLIWAGDVDIEVIRGKPEERVVQLMQRANYTVINYEQLVHHRREIRAQAYDGVIFDEAHYLKNRKTRRFKAAETVLLHCRPTLQLYLTGTPITNYPTDLWTLLHLISPGQFSSYWDFVRKYLRVRNVGTTSWPIYKVVGVLDEQAFVKDLAPFYLRREKKKVYPDLPPIIETEVLVELTGQQRTEYDRMEVYSFSNISSEKEVTAAGILARIVRLKQIALSLNLLDKADSAISGDKLETLQELLDETPDSKVVVFSQFADVILRLPDNLFGMREYFTYTGDMSEEERERTIFKWESSDNGVLGVSMLAGGLGLNLQAANVCIFLDKHSSPAVNKQAIGRLHRIGQQLPVNVYYLHAENTVDDNTRSLLLIKELLARFAMEADYFDELLGAKE